MLLAHKSKLLLGLLLLALIAFESTITGDFHIFLEASKDLFQEENIYANKYHEWYHYYYDLFFATLIYPLTYLPLYFANFIWLLLNLFFTYRIYQIIVYFLPFEAISQKRKNVILILSSIFIFTLWHRNIHLIQMTICILYLCLEGIYRIEKKQLILGSFLIALGVSVKLLPIVLLPYLFYRAQFKALLLVVLFILVLTFFPILFFGMEHTLFLLQERWNLINPTNSEHVLDVTERSFHSLTTLLAILFVEDAGNVYSLEIKRNIANVSHETLAIIINIVRGVFILGTFFFLKTRPFTPFQSKTQTFYELSYILLVIPLIFPHQQHYAFYFAFPAITYLVFFYVQFFQGSKWNIQKTLLIILFSSVFLLLNSHFLLGAYRNYYDHFKTLTYGILILVPILFFARPKLLKC